MIQKLLKNAERKVSLTKIGILIVAVSQAIITKDLAPDSVDKWLEILIIAGYALGGIGIRDALSKLQIKFGGK